MNMVQALSFLVGFVLVLYAEFRMRAPGAPPVGSGPRGLPHQRAHIFTPAGFRVSVLGWTLWAFSGVIAVVRLLRG